jgi:hypothetical protein
MMRIGCRKPTAQPYTDATAPETDAIVSVVNAAYKASVSRKTASTLFGGNLDENWRTQWTTNTVSQPKKKKTALD